MGTTGSTTAEAQEVLGGNVSEGIIPGQSTPPKDKGPYGTTEVRYFVATLSDKGDLMMLQHIMTTSLRCQNTLVTPGDIAVLNEESTTTKEGGFIIKVKYLTIPADAEVDA